MDIKEIKTKKKRELEEEISNYLFEKAKQFKEETEVDVEIQINGYHTQSGGEISIKLS